MVFDILSNITSTPVMDSEYTVGTLLFAIIFMIAGFVIARIIRSVFDKNFAPKLPEHTAKNASKFLYYGIIIISFLAVVMNQGIDLTGVILAGGIFGVVIGFATQSVVSNLISGIFLMIEKPIKVNDQVEIQGMDIMGYVLDVGIFSTKIRKYDWTVVRIPNDKLFTSNMRSLYASSARRVDTIVGIAYKEDVKESISIMKKAIEKKMPYVLMEPAPEFYVEELADSSVNIRVLVRHPKGHWDDVEPILPNVIKEALGEAGIEIPFPQRVIWQEKQ